MKLAARLEAAISKQAHLVERVNALAAEQQQVLQEALRVEGEIRLLKTMQAEGEKGDNDG